jgi:hypothetical protein
MSDLTDYLSELEELVWRHNIVNLVETGIGTDYDRGGLAMAQRLGLLAFSCDVDPACCRVAGSRFPSAIIGEMESTHFLREIVPRLAGPTFAWLDAHLSDAGAPLWPLYDDLQVFRERTHDVIWCDDMQHIVDPANPIKDQRVGYDRPDGTTWPGDTEHTLAEYIVCLESTHLAEVVGTVLRFTPKAMA